MKRGLKYKIIAPIFGSLFTALVVGAITSASSMIISGLVSLLVIGFITSLIIAKIVKPLADSAAKMNQSLGEISTGSRDLSTTLTALESLIHEMKANSEKEIENSSKEIDNIMNIINDLRFRAHLLALNATVEAARAGEAGRGFTLIAAEIKNLAQKTAGSSKTLQALVTQNMASAKKALQLVNESSGFFSTVMKTINELS